MIKMPPKYLYILTIGLTVLFLISFWGFYSKSPMEPKNFSFDQINWYALRAHAAYSDPESIRSTFPDVVHIESLPNSNVQYFIEILDNEKKILISVRGTDNLHNVIEDGEYLKTYNSKLGIYIHDGFNEDSALVYDSIIQSGVLNKEYEILLTGHSLGAAISTILMAYLHEDGYSVGLSYNFGQPKFTNEDGVKKYHFLPLVRVVDENDVVPLVPPLSLLSWEDGYYSHVGEQINLLSNEYYSYLDKRSASKHTFGDFWRNIDDLSVANHKMDNYLKNIQSKITISKQVPYSKRGKYLQNP